VRVTGVLAATAVVTMLNAAVAAFALTVTEAGTEATAGLEEVRATASPPAIAKAGRTT
jgi:hypothetical protein